MRNTAAEAALPGPQIRRSRSAAPPVGLDAALDLADAPDWEVLRERALRRFRQSIEAAGASDEDA